MIRHIVMFRFQEEYQGRSYSQLAEEIKTGLDLLPAQVPSLLRMEVGLDVKGGDNHHLVLTADFSDFEGLEAYRIHPAHVQVQTKVRQYMVPGSRSCVDYEI